MPKHYPEIISLLKKYYKKYPDHRKIIKEIYIIVIEAWIHYRYCHDLYDIGKKCTINNPCIKGADKARVLIKKLPISKDDQDHLDDCVWSDMTQYRIDPDNKYVYDMSCLY